MFRKRFRTIHLLNPRSSESWMPFTVLTTEIRFDFLFIKHPFGMLIQVPFLWLRWGSA